MNVDDKSPYAVSINLDDDNDDDMPYTQALCKYDENEENVCLQFMKASTFAHDDMKSANRTYTKLRPKCKWCECEDLVFMEMDVLPSQAQFRCIDRNMEQCDLMEYSSLKAMNYVVYHHEEDVSKNEFYYYCAKCRACVCAGCVLVDYEHEWRAECNGKPHAMDELQARLMQTKKEVDFWKKKHEQLSKQMQGVLQSMK